MDITATEKAAYKRHTMSYTPNMETTQVSARRARQARYRETHAAQIRERAAKYREARKEQLQAQRSARYHSDSTVRERAATRGRLWREANKARTKEYDAARQVTQRESRRARSKAWGEANRERARERAKAWKAANRERAKQSERRHRAEHPEQVRKRERDKQARNPGVYTAKNARRRAARLQATPSWADHAAIDTMYRMAAFMGLQVDHIEPLQAPNACGLHVPWNLQLLTGPQNAAKGNRTDSGIVGIRA